MKKIISGKVREVYDLEDGRMVIVTTDRISAFDVILPTMITDKGKVLNSLANFWFDYTKDIVKNHMISSDLKDMPEEFQKPEFEGRTILVKKLKMIPYEVIVRGYMFGSMYEAYKKGEPFLGHKFDKEYKQAEKLEKPIVTPSTKAAEGHDINVTLQYMKDDLGEELADVAIYLLGLSEILGYDLDFDFAWSCIKLEDVVNIVSRIIKDKEILNNLLNTNKTSYDLYESAQQFLNKKQFYKESDELFDSIADLKYATKKTYKNINLSGLNVTELS